MDASRADKLVAPGIGITVLFNRDLRRAVLHPTLKNTFLLGGKTIGTVQVNGTVTGGKSIGRRDMYFVDDGTAEVQVLFNHDYKENEKIALKCRELSHWQNRLPEDDLKYLPDHKAFKELSGLFFPEENELFHRTIYRVKQESKLMKTYFRKGSHVQAFGNLFYFDDRLTVSAYSMFQLTTDERTQELKERLQSYDALKV